jgi:hypothetical protein
MAAMAVSPHSGLAAEWSQSFAGGDFDYNRLQIYGPVECVSPGPNGLQVTLKAGEEPSGARVEMRGRVEGDFEISGGFEIVDLPEPNRGTGAGLSISIRDIDGEWVTVQYVRHHKSGPKWVAHRGVHKGDGKYDSSAVERLTAATRGRLAIRRAGSTIHFLVDESGSGAFTEIHSAEFTSRPVEFVHFGPKKGGANTAVNVVLTDMTARADSLRFHSEGSGSWLWPAIAVFGFLGVGGGIAAVVLMKRKR